MNLNFFELMSFAKLFSVAMGYAPPQSVSKQEYDMCVEILKRNADNQIYWTQEQKQTYKLCADIVKEMYKG